PGTNRFEVLLEKGKIICEHGKLSVYEAKVSEREFCFTTKEGFAIPEGKWIEVETDGENPQHVGVLKAFAGAVLRGEPLVANGVEGIRGLTLSNAMHLSAWTNEMVELPLDEDLFLEKLNERRAGSKQKSNVAEAVFDTKGSYGS
ncbi:MAG: gfo/Idh/MocA family oxidoreductase, partial [Lachnospiraceae bacterium]|nr:gfo/Idh/MocA family oxidoreductase [Lachnospiraceae bacterium]